MLAIILFCFGRQVFTHLFFPLALTIFMIPLPTLLQTRIGVPLKLLSTGLGVGLLRVAGVSVFVEGNIIDLGVTQLQVVDACSGLRYILPLLALGVIFGHFFEKSLWKRVILAVSTIPIAILANGIRIGITGFIAQNYGPESAEGFFHGFSGWLIFVFALSLMVVCHRLLLLLPSRNRAGGDTKSPDSAVSEAGTKSSANWTAVVMASLLLLAGGLWTYRLSTLPPLQIRGGLSSFPLTIDEWTGTTETLDPKIVELSGAEEAFNAAYFTGGGGIVSLYIGFRGSPFNESANFFHSPNVCMPSLGWKTLQIGDHVITGIPVFGEITVRRMLIEKMGVRQLVYYWFQTNRRVSADVNRNRLHLTYHALERENTYDLFIRPITPLGPDEDPSAAEARLDRFTRTLMSTMTVFLADNIVQPDPAR
jgi:exosortase D (VPLPA-CTERM-specific)